ncbi:multidrug transporter [Metasolibacillus meyeri]|uniref:Multidrug transporter n=1 Tax=Metasolibacillus meyeri TaxID=1071052 RepID=A0AAW9NKM8_9BACL|nr:multidrug transporter [Metasolibacillus meyeri]MEC1179329.1 multidrug transporter [Metasolibacillus meyeri]
MLGSILINCWIALISFTAYFIYAIQNPLALPIPTILTALGVALIAFVVAFPLRHFLGYIFYTPEEIVFSEQAVEDVHTTSQEKQPFIQQNATSTVEFADESTEDIAQVVRTMMHKEDKTVNS